jgi:hypothetical protein
MDPDLGDPKTYGSDGSGSATLLFWYSFYFIFFALEETHFSRFCENEILFVF